MPEKKITVPRGELLRLLGLPQDSAMSDAELVERAQRRAAELAGERSVAAAEQLARAEDRRIVLCAVNDGRIPKGRIDFWVDALQRDREGNRALLASFAPGLRPAEQLVVDAEVEATHRRVLERLGLGQPQTVAAAEQLSPYPRTVRDADGFGRSSGERVPDPYIIPDFPAPQRVSQGKPMSEWTEQERADAVQRRLGPRFYPGTQPPPKSDQWYWPSPNDPFEFDEGLGQWREKRGYRARG